MTEKKSIRASKKRRMDYSRTEISQIASDYQVVPHLWRYRWSPTGLNNTDDSANPRRMFNSPEALSAEAKALPHSPDRPAGQVAPPTSIAKDIPKGDFKKSVYHVPVLYLLPLLD